MDFNILWQNILANKYLTAIAIFLGFYVGAELLKFITEKIFTKAAKKTKSKLDDFLIKKTKRPISFLLMIIGIRLGFVALKLEGQTLYVSMGIINSILVILVIYLAIAIIKLMFDFWGETFAKKTKSTVDDHLITVMKKAMNIIFFIAVVLAILKVWGIEIGPLLAGVGIGGVAIAFALQKSLGNIFGGISLILDKSVAVGDVVVLEDKTMGTILDIGLRSTKIKTFDNEVIIVPNGKLEEMNIQNVVKPEPAVRVVIPFGVAYGSDVQKVKKTVMKVISKIEGVILDDEDKAPIVRFLEMAESSLNFKAFFYIETYENRFRAIDEATTKIYDALNKAKVSIPFPQMEIWMNKAKK